mmetsp:Transcript_50723/g.164039  ORF Transcript_50723/g.164039 Transcript_50723/m.164039 type:complete len:101 (-) Transcript_50723:201-503(-)
MGEGNAAVGGYGCSWCGGKQHHMGNSLPCNAIEIWQFQRGFAPIAGNGSSLCRGGWCNAKLAGLSIHTDPRSTLNQALDEELLLHGNLGFSAERDEALEA